MQDDANSLEKVPLLESDEHTANLPTASNIETANSTEKESVSTQYNEIDIKREKVTPQGSDIDLSQISSLKESLVPEEVSKQKTSGTENTDLKIPTQLPSIYNILAPLSALFFAIALGAAVYYLYQYFFM